MHYRFCPSHWLDDVRRLAACTNPIDLVLLVLVAAFGLGMCLTLAADAEIGRSTASLGFSQAVQVKLVGSHLDF